MLVQEEMEVTCEAVLGQLYIVCESSVMYLCI